MKKIYFEDHGQDFLWWTIDRDGFVIDCGPFQASVWVGSQVLQPYNLKVGGEVDFNTKRGSLLTLKYKIKKIEAV